MPFLAPYLAERLVAQGDDTSHRTTLDRDLQAAVARLDAGSIAVSDPHVSGADLVVDNHSAEVLVHIGALDYFEEQRDGMVDMTGAIRSPESALKPFIYAQAFGRRLIHPDVLIDDRPRDFGRYRPTNFDDGFHGVVSMREALAESLNASAVAVLISLGSQPFDTAWRDAGLALHYPTDFDRPGLPIAMGGVGVKLETLVTAYAALADGGTVRPLTATAIADETDVESLEHMPDFAAWCVADILRDAPRATGFT